MIKTITTNLQRINSLSALSPNDYTDSSVGPYHSSIGSHVRHILDIFNCIIDGFDSGSVDLSRRVRGVACETDICSALAYLDNIIAGIESLRAHDNATRVTLIDDLGKGKVATPSTLGSALFQAHSHAIHHFAIIGYLLHNRSVSLPDTAFGYNPTTPIVPRQ